MDRVVFLENTDRIPEKVIHILYEGLPPNRKIKADALADSSDRTNSILAYHLLSVLLKRHYDISAPNIDINKSGKPILKDTPDIHFSLSHNGYCVCCAVGVSPIGIDVQKVSEYNDSMARYICSDCEYALLQKSNEKDIDFTRLWCKKESLLKVLGKNLDCDLKLFENEYHNHTFKYLKTPSQSYIISVCC